MRAIIRGGAERAQEVSQAGRAISGMVQTARVVVGDTAYAIVTPVEQVFPDSAPTEAAPRVVALPAIPAGAVGQVVTLNYGTASGLPAPTATAVLTRDGTPVTIPGNRQITLAAGAYVLTVTWANGVGTPAVGTASRTITATPAVSMTTPPTASPLSATVGDTVTLGLGTYQNAVSVVGVLMQGGVDRTAQITNGVWSPAVAGAFTWTVTATGASGSPIVNTVSGTIAATPAEPRVSPPLDLYRQSGVPSGAGWLGNVNAPLPSTAATMLTTYTPPENVIHPCMVELPQPLLGFKYISAITAYPSGPALEDPFVYGSNDRVSWTFLGTTPQPLDVKAAVAGAYNSDTFITHDPVTGELVVGYRAVVPVQDQPEDVIVYIRRTKDGNNWTARQEILRTKVDTEILLAPTVIYDPVGGLWHMWAINRPVMQHWTAPSLEGPWVKDAASVSLAGFATPQHHEVKWVGNRLACLLYSRGDGNLFFGVFADGSWTNITWSRVGVLSPRPTSIYKASFIPVWNEAGGTIAFDIWWTSGAAGPAGGVDTGLGRRLQYARTNAVAPTSTPVLNPPAAGTLAAPVVNGPEIVGGTLTPDTGGASIAGYNFNWQWNMDGSNTATNLTNVPGGAPLVLDSEWLGRYVRFRYRQGAAGNWVVSPFVGPVLNGDAPAT